MMKKWFATLLVLAMMFACTACSLNEAKEDENEYSQTSSVTDASTEPESVPDDETVGVIAAGDFVTYQIPMENIYFDYPAEMNYFMQSYTQVLYTDKDALVGICFNFDEYTGSVDEVYDYLMPHFLNDASTTSRGTLFDAPYELISAENVTVNGMDSSKFNVKVTCEEGWDCHVYGYSFVIDGIACAVIGVVSTEEQAADMIAEYEALVDQIAGTVRTTP